MSVDLIGFLGVVLAAYVVPGPDFLVVLRSAAEHPSRGGPQRWGPRPACACTCSPRPSGSR